MHYGKRALAHLRLELPLQVLMSNAGFYIGVVVNPSRTVG